MIEISPITKSNNIKKINSYPSSITSDGRLVNRGVENFVCLDTGLIFNADGARGEEESFYSDDYDLHSENKDSEFRYFENDESVGIYEDICDFICSTYSGDENPTIIDIGCGKGLLLKQLENKYPRSELFGVEPSSNAKRFFDKVHPNIQFFEGIFEKSPFKSGKYDLIVMNGVVEHVPYPLDFLKQIKDCLAEDGIIYVGVPNLINNPADMFTWDHLSRFTPETLSTVFSMAGLKIVSSRVSDMRVPMWFLVTHCDKKHDGEISNSLVLEGSANLVEKTLSEISETFTSYNKAASSAMEKNGKIAIYGTGNFALLGTIYSELKIADIAFFVDDNETIWGSEKLGLRVCSPAEILQNDSITDVIISANPCYFSIMGSKISSLLHGREITIHVPKV